MSAGSTSPMHAELVIKIADGVGHLSLDRPQRRNAISESLFVQLREAVEVFGTDDRVRVIVLRSAVPRIFSAGADIHTLADSRPNELDRQFGLLMTCVDAIRGVSKPVVAVVQGDCLGAGCSLVAAADFVVADEGARFSLPEIHLDLAPVLAMAALFPVVSVRNLVYWAATGRFISSEDARAAGLVTLVVPPSELDSSVASLVSDLKRPSSVTLGHVKRTATTLARQVSDDERRGLFDRMIATATFPNTQAAIGAFLKRKRSG